MAHDRTRIDVEAEAVFMLRISLQDYRVSIFEAGLEYLDSRCSEADKAALQECQEFWDWWLLAWEARGSVPLTRLRMGLCKPPVARAEWAECQAPANILEKVPAFVRRAAP